MATTDGGQPPDGALLGASVFPAAMPPSRDVLYRSNTSGRRTTGGRSAPTPRDGADRRVRECTGSDILLSGDSGAASGTFVAAEEGCVEAVTTGGATVSDRGSSAAFRFLGTAPSDMGGGGGGTMGREVDPARERLATALPELREPVERCSSRAGEML